MSDEPVKSPVKRSDIPLEAAATPVAGAPISPVLPVQPLPIAGQAVTLTPGQTVTTKTPSLAVAGFSKAGTYTFSLIVQDNLGISSKPASIQVSVRATT